MIRESIVVVPSNYTGSFEALNCRCPLFIQAMKSGRDATRRNRNIGTAKRGHGLNNKLVIPTRCHPDLTIYYENLRNYRSTSREIEGPPDYISC